MFEASNTTSIWLLGNRTELLCMVLKDMAFILVDQRYIGIHLCGVSSDLNRCTPPQHPRTINTDSRYTDKYAVNLPKLLQGALIDDQYQGFYAIVSQAVIL